MISCKKVIEFRKGKTAEEIYDEKAKIWKKKISESNKKTRQRIKKEEPLKELHRIEKLRKKVKEKMAIQRKGKTYKEIYGDRAEEESKKRSLAHKKRWDKIGRKYEERPYQGCNTEYTKWRKKVFEKDNYTCQICFIRGGYLEAHHIKAWSKYPDLRYSISNGLTVHKGKCHKKAACIERKEALKGFDKTIYKEDL